jgi:hypothetical protein
MRGRMAEIRSTQDRQRMVVHELATLVAFAFHDPKHIPEFRSLGEKPKVDDRQRLVNDAKVRAWFMAHVDPVVPQLSLPRGAEASDT